MSIENEAAVTEPVNDDVTEEVVSEQPQPELESTDESQEIAASEESTEENPEVDETNEAELLVEALSGKAEPEKENHIPRSTARALRKNKRLEKQNQALEARVRELEQAQFKPQEAQVPQRDWDNETDEQYQFRQIQSALNHQSQSSAQLNEFNERKNAEIEAVKKQKESIENYANEVDSLGIKNYDEIEDRVLGSFDVPEIVLPTMAQLDAKATSRILIYLDQNPDELDELVLNARNNRDGFFSKFGELRARVNDIESKVKNRKRQVSKATGDKGLHSTSGGSLEAKMQKAADSGDFKTYRKLKAQKYNRG